MRFGRPKATATLPDGTGFADAITRTARACGVDQIVLVVPRGHGVPPGTMRVENPAALSEQIRSVRLGLAQLANSSADGALIWPVDCPLVRAETVSALLHVAEAEKAAIAIPTFEGRRGHPSWFSRKVWPELMTASDGGARAVIHRDKNRVHEVVVQDRAVLADIDTPADLERAAVGVKP